MKIFIDRISIRRGLCPATKAPETSHQWTPSMITYTEKRANRKVEPQDNASDYTPELRLSVSNSEAR